MKTALIIMFLMLMSIVGFSQESPIWTDSLKVKLNGTYTNITPTLESLTSGNIDSALSILYVPDTTISPGDFTRTGHLSTRIYTALKRQAMIDFLAMNWGYVTPAMFQHPDVPYAPSAYGGNADSNTVYMQRAIQRAASLRTRLWNVKTWEGWKMDFNLFDVGRSIRTYCGIRTPVVAICAKR